MPTTDSPRPGPLWAAVVLAAVLIAVSLTPSIANLPRFVAMFVAPAAGLAIYFLWQVGWSRAPWRERRILLATMVCAPALTVLLADASMRTALWIYGVPIAVLAVALGSTLGRRWTSRRRTALTAALIVGGWMLFLPGRLTGFDGGYLPQLSWRWQPTAEDALAAVDLAVDETAWAPDRIEWPGYRGPSRRALGLGVGAPLDWSTRPPTVLWRAPVGPGWSSFAAASGRLFTQEQRGDDEIVSCLDAATGQRLWEHRSPGRFEETVSGAGPRATPLLAGGRVVALGARGGLTALDAGSGRQLWRRDLRRDFGAPIPMWAFASSPLRVPGPGDDDLVVVHAGGTAGRGLVALALATGELVWSVATAGETYTSAELLTLDGVAQVVFTDADAVFSLDPATGEELWRVTPERWRGMAMVQPQAVGPTSLLVPLGDGIGLAHLEVRHGAAGWSVEERWSSRAIKPSFNDFVVHRGHVYGFDQNIFVSVDLETGARNWKRGRYGFGQVVLLPQAEQLLVQGEGGDLVLLAADPTEHRELGRIEVLDGKTWNHPIVVDGRAFVRNGQEMVALDLGPDRG